MSIENKRTFYKDDATADPRNLFLLTVQEGKIKQITGCTIFITDAVD